MSFFAFARVSLCLISAQVPVATGTSDFSLSREAAPSDQVEHAEGRANEEVIELIGQITEAL